MIGGKMISRNDIDRIKEFSRSKSTTVLTIMFTDIIGYTSFAENNNEEKVQEFRAEHDKRLNEIISNDQKGLVVKFIGDSLLAVFISPSEGAKKAIELKREFKSISEKYGVNLDLRIGLHMGEVLLDGDENIDIFGRHVNKTQRIESLAHKGQIFMTYPVYDSIRNRIDDEYRLINHGKYKLKGIKNPEEIYELVNFDNKGSKPKLSNKNINIVTPAITLTVIALITTIYLLFFSGNQYNLFVASREDGELYVNGKYNGKLENNIGIQLNNMPKILRLKVELDSGEELKKLYVNKNRKNKLVFLDTSNNIYDNKMVLVEKGENAYGKVEKDFYMAKHEVTQGEYIYIVNRETSNTNYAIGDNYPNNSMTFMDALEFCNELSRREGLPLTYEINIRTFNEKEEISIRVNDRGGYRLPTFEEWKYAAAGGKYSKNYIYSGSNRVEEVGNVYINGVTRSYDLKEVMSYGKNELGIFDMTGNISEWTIDIEKGEEKRGLLAGSNFKINENYSKLDYRYFMDKERAFMENGLRVVRSKID